MSESLAPPSVTIRRYPASRICDVVVVVRGQEMVIRCPTYFQAVKWARLECKSYKIPEPDTNFPDNNETDDLPLFYVQIKINEQCSGSNTWKKETPILAPRVPR